MAQFCDAGFATKMCMRCVYKMGSALVAFAMFVSNHLQAVCTPRGGGLFEF